MSTYEASYQKRKNQVSIEETLVIKSDVDYHTGNIFFPGNVSVKGKIHDLFSLKVGGDLTFDSTIDAWEIFCKGNLSSKAGLIGKGRRHLVRIKGRVNLKFIENCSLESLATIYIQRSCMNAFVATTDRICLGKGGKIVASEVYAGGGVYADELGNRSGQGISRCHYTNLPSQLHGHRGASFCTLLLRGTSNN